MRVEFIRKKELDQLQWQLKNWWLCKNVSTIIIQYIGCVMRGREDFMVRASQHMQQLFMRKIIILWVILLNFLVDKFYFRVSASLTRVVDTSWTSVLAKFQLVPQFSAHPTGYLQKVRLIRSGMPFPGINKAFLKFEIAAC